MKRESFLRRSMVLSLRAAGCIAQPIESGTTGLGIPDLFVRTTKTSAWVELKNFKYAISYPWAIPFRPKQKEWLDAYHKLGGVSVLVVAEPKGVHVFVGKNIKQAYSSEADKADLFMKKFNGKDFIRLLDAIKG